ncbi:MAG TPA: PepSY-like domain-containing protein [Candidatus Avirikenella pullistercoris]|nr:PepSY-like domain-containing protein [Candidatus Avirikenella pullistercoris]
MKKILFVIALLFAGIATANASPERPITIDQLPKTAQEFLAAHFKDLTVAYAVAEQKFTGTEYEVVYTDRTEVDFRSDGQWDSVERKYSAIPDSIVPQQIRDFVAKNNYPGQFIKKIERNAYTWEIELSSDIEIKFDVHFNVIDIDD